MRPEGSEAGGQASGLVPTVALDPGRRRSARLLGTVLAAAGVLAIGSWACVGRTTPTRLGVAVPFNLGSLDPHRSNTVAAYDVLSALYEPLAALDEEMRVVPRLAASWENPDPLTWVFRLRPRVRFHDGHELTADDVVHSLRRVMADPQLRIRVYLASISEVSARDPLTVVVRTRWPNAQLAGRLHQVLIVPKGVGSVDLDAKADGTGPYALESWAQRSRIALRRHEAYWGSRAAFAGIDIDTSVSVEDALRGMQDGRYQLALHSALANREALLDARGFSVVRRPGVFLRHLAFDVERKTTPFCPGIRNPFRNPAVRQAFHLALDRNRIAAAVAPSARPANQLVPKAVFGFDPALPPFAPDLGAARRLLASAGLGSGFEVTLHRGGFEAAANAIRDQLAELAVRVKIEVLPGREFFEALERRELSFWIVASGAVAGDGLQILEAAFHSPDAESGFGADNHTGYRNPELDRAIREAPGIADPQRRKASAQTLLRQVLEERVWLPLYFDEDTYVVADSVRLTPRQDGYLSLAGIRPAR